MTDLDAPIPPEQAMVNAAPPTNPLMVNPDSDMFAEPMQGVWLAISTGIDAQSDHVSISRSVLDAVAKWQRGESHAALAAPPTPRGEKGTGWVSWNPDVGEEYTPNHPIESGECVVAERIRQSTPQEDTLWQAFQGEFNRAHDLETQLALSTPRTEIGEDARAVGKAIRPFVFALKCWRDLKELLPTSDGAKAGPQGFVTLSDFERLDAAFAAATPAPVVGDGLAERLKAALLDEGGDAWMNKDDDTNNFLIDGSVDLTIVAAKLLAATPNPATPEAS